jgi:hypothetical protein
MLPQFIWSASIALEVFLLARGLQQKLTHKYPIFYSYIAYVLAQEFVSLGIYYWNQHVYRYTYWLTEFVGVLIGCGVVFEIYRIGLAAYPGTARMARRLLAILFAIASVKALVEAANDPRWWLQASAVDVEAALRAIQGLAIISLVTLFVFYSIPFGKSLRGILLGYGLFVCWSVICLTYASDAVDRANSVWAYTSSASYMVALALWCGHLWSYQANRQPKRVVHLEQDYQRVAAATQRRLHDARAYMAKAVGS